MSFGDYCVGLAFFAGTWGAVGAGAFVIVRRRLAYLATLPAVTAGALLFTAGICAAALIPAMFGVLTRGTMVGAAALIMLVAMALSALKRPDEHEAASSGREHEAASSTVEGEAGSRVSAEPSALRTLAIVAVAAVAFCVLLFLRFTFHQPVEHVDTMAFHLPDVVRWIQTGSIWQNVEFLPLLPTGAYPSNGSLVYLTAVLPWHNAAFVRLVNVPFLMLAGAAMFATARELGAPRALSRLIAAMVLAVPAIMLFAVDRIVPDVILLAMLAAAMLFLVRHLREPRRAELILAGLGLGLAFGTKWYGLSLVIGVGIAWLVAARMMQRTSRTIAVQGGALVGLVLGAGGIWLVRNWVETGDPLFPAKIAPAGVTIFNPPADPYLKQYDFSLFDRIGQTHVWLHTIIPDLRNGIGLGGPVLAVGVIVAFVLLLRRRTAATGFDPAVLMLALSAVLVTAAYVVTPATAQGTKAAPWPGLIIGNSRYLMPALILAAPVTAWSFAQLRRGAVALGVVAGVAVIDGLVHTFSLSARQLVEYGALFLVAGAVVVGLLPRLRALQSRSAALTATLGVAIVAAGFGQYDQSRFNRLGYRGQDAAVDWVLTNADGGHRVAMAGAWGSGPLASPVLPLFGPRLANYVAYAGPTDRGMLLEYSDAKSFLNALLDGRFDVLLVGRGNPPTGHVPEQDWARAADFVPVAESDRFLVYRSPSFRA